MTKVCVITGGGSGMGLEVAKLMGDAKVVITGRTVAKLKGAIEEIKAAGVDAVAFACDASDPASVDALVEFACSLGTVKTVIHAAGVSPHMGDGAYIWKINTCGTMNVDEKFAAVMDEGGVILNVSSMSAYMLPAERTPYALYEASAYGTEALEAGFAQVLAQVPAEMQPGMAYTMSKNFVIWYTKRAAVKYGPKGIRVVSISPGTFTTPMGKLEGDEAAKFGLSGAMGRLGEPVEIARMMAFMV
ncbi:MAG: SDR family NAD(P)-dependent oxidoreductase, partial [Atopobiaceae bacterium]|nr:SDR family NAD(P)-dependent oxidoreductase [Atopobiaceae bacterium]